MSIQVILIDPTDVSYDVTPIVLSCLDANVRGGTYDDVTFPASHALALNQELLYRSSAGHDIGGLHNGMLYYVKTIPSPASITLSETPGGATIDLTVPAGGDTHSFITQGSGHDLRAESLPELSLSLANGDSEVESGDMDFVFQNYDAWFDTRWMQPDPEQFYSEAAGFGCWNIQLKKNGVLRWVGDLDPHSVKFDIESKSVSATFFGKLKRLERYNAEYVRRAIPQYSDAGSGFTALGGGVYRATLTNTYRVNAFLNHRFVDYAGDVFTISASTASSGHSVDLTLAGGTPTAGAFNIRSFVWVTDRNVSQRIMTVRQNKDLTDGPTIATLGLEAGDKVNYTKLRFSGNVKQQELEIQQVGPHTSTGTGDPTLTAYQVQLKTRLQCDLNQNCASSCTTPYWRNIAPRDLAIEIFDHCGIDSSKREINIPLSASGSTTAVASGYLEDTSADTPITADDQFNGQWIRDSLGNRFKVTDTVLSTKRLYVYGTPAAGAYEIHFMVCEYAEMEGKSCGAAMKELADNASALIFTTPAKYHLLSCGQSKAGVTPKNIDALVLKGETIQALSDESVSLVKVTGPEEGVYAQKGALIYPEATLEISTDFLTSRGTMEQIAAVKWVQECRRKRPAVFPVLDDGTAYQIFDEVVRTVAGVATTFQVTSVREPLLAVDDECRTTLELEAIEKTGLAFTTGDGAVGAEAIDKSPPPAPVILAVTRSYDSTFDLLYPKKHYPRWYKGEEVIDKSSSSITFKIFKRDLYEIKIAWPYDDLGGNLLGFVLQKRWDGSDPDKPIGYCSWMDPEEQSDGFFYWPPDEGQNGSGGIMYVRRGKKVWFSARAVYEDGRMSPLSDEVGTVIGDETVDGAPAPTLGTVTSYKKNRTGTARVECDLTIPATHFPCDQVEFSFQDPEGVTTKPMNVPQGAGYREMNAEDANVRDGVDDDVTFPNAHGWATNQRVVYNSSAGHDIGGLTSGSTYYVIASSTTAIQLKTSMFGAKIDLTVPAGGDLHYFTPLLATTAYFKGLTRNDNITDIKARCVAEGKPGNWSTAASITAGASSAAIALPRLAECSFLKNHKTKAKIQVKLNSLDSAETKKTVAAVEIYIAPRWTPTTPAPDDESGPWEKVAEWDVAKQAANGKSTWKGWLQRDDEDATDKFRPAVAIRLRTCLDNYSYDSSTGAYFAYIDVGMSLDLQNSAASGLDVTMDAVASGGTGPYSYRVDWGDGTAETFSSGSGMTHSYNAAGAYTVSVVATDSTGGTPLTASAALALSMGGIYTSDGVYFPGSGASAARSSALVPPGSATQIAWTNPGRIVANDNSYATCQIAPGQFSQDLIGASFGASLPTANTHVKGARVTIGAKADYNTSTRKAVIAWVQLYYNGVALGNPIYSDTPIPTSETAFVFGGAGALWNAAITPAMMNNALMQVAMGIGLPSGVTQNVTVSVDYITLEPFYDDGY